VYDIRCVRCVQHVDPNRGILYSGSYLCFYEGVVMNIQLLLEIVGLTFMIISTMWVSMILLDRTISNTVSTSSKVIKLADRRKRK
jgi:hypothetical protein